MAQYEILIKNGTNGAEDGNPIANDKSKGKKPKAEEEKSGKISAESVAGYMAFKRVVAAPLKRAINYQISTVALRTGSMERQQRIQFVTDTAGQVASTVESGILAFAATGGNPAGALLGALIDVVGKVMTAYQKINTLNLNQRYEQISIGLQNARYGGSVGSTMQSRN